MTDADRSPSKLNYVGLLTGLVFFVATAELAVIGLDDQIATELGFPDTSIGYMVSAYAVGMIVGGPLLVAIPAARRANPAVLLGVLTVAYAVLTALAAAAPSLSLFVGARAIAGAFGSAVIGSCIAYGSRIATESERGAAQAWVLSGLTFGTTFGLPITSFLSTVYSWRMTLLLIGAGALLFGVVGARIVPGHFVPNESVENQAVPRPAFAATALRFATSAFVTAAVFSVFSSAAVLLRSAGIADQRQAVVLFGYGLATIIGTVIVGALIAKAGEERITAIGSALLTVLLVGAALLSALNGIELAIFFLLLGMTGVSMNPAFAVRVIKTGGVGVVVNTLHSSVINCGIVVGGVIAGAVTRSDGGNSSLFTIAAALAGAALLTVLAARKRSTDQRSIDHVRT